MSTRLFDIEKQLKRFLTSEAHSELLKETNGLSGISIIEAQVQKRWLNTDSNNNAASLAEYAAGKTNCLNIVNVCVAERNRRKGLFKDFLELLEIYDYSLYFDNCPCFYLRIDKVMNPVLDEFLPRRGFTRTKPDNETHFSYYKMVRKINTAVDEYIDQPSAAYAFT